MQGSRSGPLLSTFSNVQASPKWSMRGKAGSAQKTTTPGPGAYSAPQEVAGKFGRSPNYGFGYASRDGIRPASAPGPGHYDAPLNPKMDVSAKYGFGTSDRILNKNRTEQPGPASYKIPGKMGYTGPKYSNVGRRDLSATFPTPGPGAYQPLEANRSTFANSQRWGFGTSPREGRGMQSAPGPGAYEQGTAVDNGPKFSMKGKQEAFSKDMTPGPGEYGGVYTCFG